MQDRYVGDAGDYGKYGLLRRLCGDRGGSAHFRLGITWCLFPDESHNGDGRHISYLQKEAFRDLDPYLFDYLKQIVASGNRCVTAIGNGGLFPPSTVFFDELVSRTKTDGVLSSPLERLAYRGSWFRKNLEATRNCDVVFFDPDNGIEISSVDKKHPKAGKYVFWDELREFWNRGQSLIIYHHLNRTASVYQQMEALKGRVSREISGQYRVVRLIFRRGSCRSYWFLLQNDIAELVEERVAKMMQSGWRQHFEMI
jgi:hypothetical protein